MNNKKFAGICLIGLLMVVAIYVTAEGMIKTDSGYILLDPADGNVYVDGDLVRYGVNDFIIRSQASKDIEFDPSSGAIEVDGGGYFYNPGQLGVSSQRAYIGHDGSDGKVTTAIGDIILDPASGKVYVDGQLGVGMASPVFNLHVYSDGDAHVAVDGASNHEVSYRFYKAGSHVAQWFVPVSSTNLALWTNAQRLTIEQDGDFGIGDSTPDRDLDIGSSSINSGDSAWTVESSRDFKDNLVRLERDKSILDKWLDVNVYRYNYKGDYLKETLDLNETNGDLDASASVIHTGLMAEEFNPAFLGSNKTDINYGDVTYQMIFAIQELIEENNNLKQELCTKDASYAFCKTMNGG
ncbi:MAG: tail fiber domain-containing protein [Candidatus Altiarchaeota archaeon]